MDEKLLKKIDTYLNKKSHINYFTVKLISYNNNYIYIRFDYVDKIKAYKVVWFDLKYINIKELDQYINMQLVTSFFANKMVEFLSKVQIDSGEVLNHNVLGDRIEIINKLIPSNIKTYTFDRFLPLEWKELIDPLALLFSYLPRSMEPILNEIFGIFDRAVDYYNSKKPIKFNLEKDNIDSLFNREIVIKGRRLEDRVEFLELVEGKYIAIVSQNEPVLVVIEPVTNDFYSMWTSLNSDYLNEYIYAVLQCIKDKKYNDFYKVKYINKNNKNLFDRVRKGDYYLSFGVDKDNLLIISNQGAILEVPILENGKCVFEVIEDDDDLSLSKIIKEYQVK